jgi:formate dehydrogenase subunit delta
MSPDKLIYMANQIARSFRSRGPDVAVASTAEHISNFWEPRMRAQLFALLEADAGRFDKIVQDARASIKPVASDAAHTPAA